MTWITAVDYQRGRSHSGTATPCQDFGMVRHIGPNLVIGAIADGAGSAPLSHFGARDAVQAAVDALAQNACAEVGGASEKFRQTGKRPLVRAAASALAALGARASKMRRPLSDFAATLIAFVATPERIAALQIGDGFLIASSPSKPYHRLCTPQRGEFAHETVFLTDADAMENANIVTVEEPISFIAAGTDGLESVSIRQKDGKPHAPFFRPFDHYLSDAREDSELHHGIRGFLRSDRLTERVADDVTLLVCGWRHGTSKQTQDRSPDVYTQVATGVS